MWHIWQPSPGDKVPQRCFQHPTVLTSLPRNLGCFYSLVLSEKAPPSEEPKLTAVDTQDNYVACTPIRTKMPNNTCKQYMHNSSYFLRQSDFSTPSFNTVTYGKHSLRYLGPKLWGKLSPDVRSAKTLNIFRKQIRKYDISLLIDNGCKGCSLCSS